MSLALSGANAQQTLPASGKDVEELIGLLKADTEVFEKAKACQQLAIVGTDQAVPELATLLSDPQLATYARSALENIPSDASDRALRESCDRLRGDNLLGVFQSIGKRRDKQAVPILSQYLADADPQIQIAAAEALGYIGTSEAAAQLKQRVTTTEGRLQLGFARACLICIQRLVEDGKNQPAKALCRDLIDAGLPAALEQPIRFQMIRAMGEQGPNELLKMFGSSDPAEFDMALYATRRIQRNAEFSIKLMGLMEELPADRHVQMLNLLADLGDRQILPQIAVQQANRDQTSLRIAALNALGKIGNADSIPTIMAALSSNDQAVIDAAIDAAIGIAAPQMDESAIAMLDSENPGVVSAAIEIVAGRRVQGRWIPCFDWPQNIAIPRSADEQFTRSVKSSTASIFLIWSPGWHKRKTRCSMIFRRHSIRQAYACHNRLPR